MIINCAKGYTWNPSICECQCDKWCKPNQYLDHKNCVCKNKLIGRLIEECTSVINETMISKCYEMFLLVYFQWLCLLELLVFACLLILSGLKVKLFKNKYADY